MGRGRRNATRGIKTAAGLLEKARTSVEAQEKVDQLREWASHGPTNKIIAFKVTEGEKQLYELRALQAGFSSTSAFIRHCISEQYPEDGA